MASATYCGYALLRSNLGERERVRHREGGRLRQAGQVLSPGRQATTRRQTTFVDAADVLFDAAIPYDATFFEALDRRVQAEPWLTRDKAMIDTLKTIGIEKGRPFTPDTATTDRTDRGHAAKRTPGSTCQLRGGLHRRPFYDDARWALPAPPELVEATTTGFGNPDSYPVDERGVAYSFAYFSAKHLGSGAVLSDDHQRQERRRLRRSGDLPARACPRTCRCSLYWSATAYDRATHTLMRDMPWASRSSNTPGLQAEERWVSRFCSSAPNRRTDNESNWVPTQKDGQFEVLCRFYGPDKAFFDKTWTTARHRTRPVNGQLG